MSFSITGWWAKEFISAALTVTPEIVAKDIASLVALLDVGVDIDALMGERSSVGSDLTVSELISAQMGLLRKLSASESVHPSLSGVGVHGVNSPGSSLVVPGSSASVSLIRHVSAHLNVSPLVTLLMLGNMSAHLTQDVNLDAEAHLHGLVQDLSAVNPSVVAAAVRGAKSSGSEIVIPALSVSATVTLPAPTPSFDAIGSGYTFGVAYDGTPVSWTHTCSPGATVFAVVWMQVDADSTCTYGSTPMNLIYGPYSPSSSGSYVTIFCLPNAVGGQASVDVTSSATTNISANTISYSTVTNVGTIVSGGQAATFSQSATPAAGSATLQILFEAKSYRLQSVSGGTLRYNDNGFLEILDSSSSTTFTGISFNSRGWVGGVQIPLSYA